MTEREQEDWLRGTYNMEPRPMDWQERVVVTGCVIVCLVMLLLILEGVVT